MKERKKRIRILFIHHNFSSFVKKDLEILKKQFDVKQIAWHGKKSILLIIKGALTTDITYCWFAGDYAGIAIFLSKMLKKKSIVVAGGYDVANEPEINYGQFCEKWYKKTLTKYALKNATLVLAVDPGIIKDVNNNAKVSGEHIEYLPTGYDPKYWKAKGNKENIVLTVASANNVSRVKIKGLETFVKSAAYFPTTKFIVIGVDGEAKKYLQKIKPKNVEIYGFLPKKDLISHYQKAKVYCQLSLREGLPNCLCEAMLCNCIPVGTDIQGVRTAIGDTGFYVPYGDEKATAEAIKKALNMPDNQGKKANERIMNFFPGIKRERGLNKAIRKIVTS
jgi:glycosyltransferase involved in cell wall biosynthesis